MDDCVVLQTKPAEGRSFESSAYTLRGGEQELAKRQFRQRKSPDPHQETGLWVKCAQMRSAVDRHVTPTEYNVRYIYVTLFPFVLSLVGLECNKQREEPALRVIH